MIGKLGHSQLVHHAKNFLGNAYHHTKRFLGNVDAGVKTFRDVYSTIAPVLESYGVNSGGHHVAKALSGYDNIRGQVLENHDRVINDVNKVRDTLQKKKLNFDFA